jgi:hypothetical protein
MGPLRVQQAVPLKQSAVLSDLAAQIEAANKKVRNAEGRYKALVAREGFSEVDMDTLRDLTEYKDLARAQAELEWIQNQSRVSTSGIPTVAGRAEAVVVPPQIASVVEKFLDFGSTEGKREYEEPSNFPWFVPAPEAIQTEERAVQDTASERLQQWYAEDEALRYGVDLSRRDEAEQMLGTRVVQPTEILAFGPLVVAEEPLSSGPQPSRTESTEQYITRLERGGYPTEEAYAKYKHEMQEGSKRIQQHEQQRFESLPPIVKKYESAMHAADDLTAYGMRVAFEEAKKAGASDDDAAETGLAYQRGGRKAATGAAIWGAIKSSLKTSVAELGKKSQELQEGYQQARKQAAEDFDKTFGDFLVRNISTPKNALRWADGLHQHLAVLMVREMAKREFVPKTLEEKIAKSIKDTVTAEFKQLLREQLSAARFRHHNDAQEEFERFQAAQVLMATLRRMRARTIELAQAAVSKEAGRRLFASLQGFHDVSWQSQVAQALNFSFH